MGNLCWIASYPKSGNTWLRAFIENYLQNRPEPVDINTLFRISQAEAKAFRYVPYVPGGDTTGLSTAEICAIRPLVQADMARQANGTAFVKTHNFLGEYQGYPLHNSSVTSGAIYIVRNPLDVVISVANYFSFTIEQAIDFLAEEMTGTGNEEENVPQVISSWSLHVESWTQNPDPTILVLRYEDMLQKPLKAFAKVITFLGQPRDANRLKKAIRFSSFNQLKSQEKQRGFIEKHEDAKSFFHSGRKNQWREKLTRPQIQKIVDRHGAQMKRFRYLPPGFPE
jgi:hypothetical protein